MTPEGVDKRGKKVEVGGDVSASVPKFDEYRQTAGESVAEQLVSTEDQDNIFRFEEFNAGLEELRKQWAQFSEVENLKESQKEDFVIGVMRSLRELKLIVNYVRGEFNIEHKDGKEIYQHSATQIVDLTQTEAFIKEVEDGLKQIKKKQQDEKSLYETLEASRDTIRPVDFLRLSLENRLKLVSNVKSWNQLTDGTLVVFDFGSNYALEYQVGLGDLMPSWIRRIAIAGVTYERRGNQGFYNNGDYLPIFDGSRVTIIDTDESYSPEKEYDDRFGTYSEEGERLERNITRKDILRVARDFLVDAYFLEAVLGVMKNDIDNDITDDYEFLHIAARYIQNVEMRFGASALDSGHYSALFIAYALDRFNLFGDYAACSDATIKAVTERYGRLKGVSLEVPKEEQKIKPAARVGGGGGGQFYGHPRETYYTSAEVIGSGLEMMRNETAWRDALYADLLAKGVSENQAKMTVFYSREIYMRMRSRLGQMYEQPVKIDSADGHSWTVKNSCVGHTMKVVENLPIAILSGSQAGEKYASNFYWGEINGRNESFLESLVRDRSSVISEHVQPYNVDEIVGRYLAVGECAAAGLYNHAFWIYKGLDGRIMMCHSGADTRPNRVSVSSVSEMPAGYRREGDFYIRIRGSKVNEVPLAYFLGKQAHKYGSRDILEFVPLRTIIADNLAVNGGKMAGQLASYYEGNKDMVT